MSALLVLALFSTTCLGAIVIHALTSERPPKYPAQQEPTTGDTARPRSNDIGGRPSTDFAALIDAIANEGSANRAEEKREDGGKQFRDWVTILLLIATTGGVYWQVAEMIKVYEPIKKQADAMKLEVSAVDKGNPHKRRKYC